MTRSPDALREMLTRSVSSRNSAGMRTAWLLPLLKTRVVSVVMTTPLGVRQCVYFDVEPRVAQASGTAPRAQAGGPSNASINASMNARVLPGISGRPGKTAHAVLSGVRQSGRTRCR
ncbi:MAG: hypothetical protein RIQ53_2724 [Pseudomonadota bacterium]